MLLRGALPNTRPEQTGGMRRRRTESERFVPQSLTHNPLTFDNLSQEGKIFGVRKGKNFHILGIDDFSDAIEPRNIANIYIRKTPSYRGPAGDGRHSLPYLAPVETCRAGCARHGVPK